MLPDDVNAVLGVGFGPANLALAVALEEFGYRGRTRFIERTPAFQWQSEQLLTGADIQNNAFRDLSMQRNPDSAYTFIKYLVAHDMLTDYLHLNAKFPLRREYAGYLAWVAAAFRSSVRYGRSAVDLSIVETADQEVFRVRTDDGACHLARNLVLGTGRTPRVPPALAPALGLTVFHASRYLSSMDKLEGRGLRVAVVGSSQSAIEILLDLLDRPEVAKVTSIQRGIGFRLKDTSPYSRRVFLPDFVDYFHPLPHHVKTRLRAELRMINYGACDADVIDRLAGIQREYALTGSDRFAMIPFSEIVGVTDRADTHRLQVRDINNRVESALDVDVVILATGYRDLGLGAGDERLHPLLAGVADRLVLKDGLPVVERDYSMRMRPAADGAPSSRLYLNGLCEASHGMGDAGALAMLSVRSTDIMESLVRADSDRPTAAAVR